MPARLRHLLDVESGLDDGLALPIVVALVALAHLVAVAVAASIVAHSSTDVLVARVFREGVPARRGGARRDRDQRRSSGAGTFRNAT